MEAMTRIRFSGLLFGACALCAAYGALAQTKEEAEAPAAANGSGLDTRVERLEEQMVDLQGVVAAVETLAKSGGGAGAGGTAPSGYSAGAGASSDQIRQLSEQLADLTQRLERLEARFGMATPEGAPSSHAALSAPANAAAAAGGEDEDRSYSARPLPPASASNSASASADTGGFGTAIVSQSATRTAEASPGSAFDAATNGPASRNSAPVRVAAVTSGAARTLYDQAYGALQRREYRASETYFQEFMKQYSNDALAPDAQFYLAESAYQSAEYRSAADRFLKAYSDYPASPRAPEALLKLAMSLKRLGESSAACDSFAELARRFPQAPTDVARRAETEKRRANCH
jgi:tol-pal system protein YbgF